MKNLIKYLSDLNITKNKFSKMLSLQLTSMTFKMVHSSLSKRQGTCSKSNIEMDCEPSMVTDIENNP